MHGKGACGMAKGGIHGKGGHVWQGACVAGEHAWQGSMAGEMAPAADGTHPTGMHSCLKSLCLDERSLIISFEIQVLSILVEKMYKLLFTYMYFVSMVMYSFVCSNPLI